MSNTTFSLPAYPADESYKNITNFQTELLAALGATELVMKTRKFALDAHKATNHKYDDADYSLHLELVFAVGCKYAHLVLQDNLSKFKGSNESPLYGVPPERGIIYALAGLWTHDAMNDARVTYNAIKRNIGVEVAELSYALTNGKGRTPEERESPDYYFGIRETPYADWEKVCDRIANARYGLEKGGTAKQFLRYKNNYPKFKDELFNPAYKPMFDELEEIFASKPITYVKCFDKFENELHDGDTVDVQMDGEHKIYKKEDGQLYFKPYGKEDRVSAYFSNDMIKVNE